MARASGVSSALIPRAAMTTAAFVLMAACVGAAAQEDIHVVSPTNCASLSKGALVSAIDLSEASLELPIGSWWLVECSSSDTEVSVMMKRAAPGSHSYIGHVVLTNLASPTPVDDTVTREVALRQLGHSLTYRRCIPEQRRCSNAQGSYEIASLAGTTCAYITTAHEDREVSGREGEVFVEITTRLSCLDPASPPRFLLTLVDSERRPPGTRGRYSDERRADMERWVETVRFRTAP